MKLQDYLHYYMGCKMIHSSHHEPQNEPYILTFENIREAVEFSDRPLLRRLEDITEEEKTHIGKLAGWYEGKKIINDHHLEVAHDTMKEMAYDCLITANDNEGDRLGPAAYFSFMPYLLRQGFDLFGLIPAGLAIDIKTI